MAPVLSLSIPACAILLFLALTTCRAQFLQGESESLPSAYDLTPSAYDRLVEHHLPPGLLPDNVLNYTLNEKNGEFTLQLLEKCSVVYPVPDDEVLVHYDEYITGTLKLLSISDLTGVSTKEFFWLSVNLIHKERVEDDVVYFNAGYLYRSFPEKVFAHPKSCSSGVEFDGLAQVS